MILGGSGLVGLAIAREVLKLRPARLVITALTEDEVREGVEALRPVAGETVLESEWGNLFTPAAIKHAGRDTVLDDPDARGMMLDALFGPLSAEAVERDTLGEMILRHRPDIVVDCVNTATAFAYQNVFKSAAGLREAARRGPVDQETLEKHLITLTLPPLIHHTWVAMNAMMTVGTRVFLKVGTAGTGGMGLNIPFTHSEDRPSRQLLAKSSIAGAQTLLLYLMARTPGAPAVKEIKPTAAISWKAIRAGTVRHRGVPFERVDAVAPAGLDQAFGGPDRAARHEFGRGTLWRETGEPLTGVHLDAGENGQFSPDEFEALTALGLMEFITPEEIALDAVREIMGYPTGHDVVAALDASTSGPTYRAGVLRETALRRMEQMEAESGGRSVAFEMLGPPRLTKLLYEAEILRRLCGGNLDAAASLDPSTFCQQADALVAADGDLRTRILTARLAVLLPDGARVLRGRKVEIEPEPGEAPEQTARKGWVDLRAENWAVWRGRAAAVLREIDAQPGAEGGSGWDMQPWHRERAIRPGALAAWIFRYEDRGERIKR
ncbi:MAG: short-chain dehydrogenase [Gemmatimonadetes bacterium]|nr:short-chain dehydrogenase [Gemmatimonadota bacterium]